MKIIIFAMFMPLVLIVTGQEKYNCADKNPCVKENITERKIYFATDNPCKFVQCSEREECMVRPCAPGTEWSQSNQTCVHASNNLCKTSDTTLPTNQNSDTYNVDCVKNNPCTDANVAANKFYFQSSDPCKFVQCNAFKQCWVRPCAPGTEWSQSNQTCVHASNNLCKTSDTTLPTNQNNDTYNVDCVKNNPCTDANVAANKFYFQSSDPCKFVHCNVFKQCWVMPCSPGTKWGVIENTCIIDVQRLCSRPSTNGSDETGNGSGGFDCGANNPCTDANVAANKFYFQSSDPCKFVQCNAFKQCWVRPCAPGTEWSQSNQTCVHASNNLCKTSDTTLPTNQNNDTYNVDCVKNNPCTDANVAANKFYFQSSDPCKFVQCNAFKQCWVRPCAPGTEWSQSNQTCVHASNNLCKTSDTTLPTNQNNDTYNVDCVKNNPCTDANVAANKFYFQSSDPCKFVHCNVFKQCWVMPCSPGTKWGVIENTCIIDVQRLCSRPSTNGSDETGNGSGGFDCGANNPCTDANVAANKFYFQSSDPCKFVQCNAFKQCWVRPCAPGTEWSQSNQTCVHASNNLCKTSDTTLPTNQNNDTYNVDCVKNNPCTDANVAANKFYFQSSDPCKFVQCNAFKQCWVRPCAPGTEWSQSNQTCVHASNNLCKTSDTTLPTNQNNDTYNVDCVKNNPCTDANVAANKFYFQSSDPCKFVQCNAFKQCWVRPCAPGTEWSQSNQTCVHASNNLCKTSDTTLPTNQNNDTYNVDCVKNNPCTDANVAANKFYFQSSDPCKFVQCNAFKQCWVRPCAPGTEWSQSNQTCVHASNNLCKTSDTTLPTNQNSDTYNVDCVKNNPCTDANVAANKFYFQSSDPCKFVQCNAFKQCWVRPCAPGTEWSQSNQTCVHASNNLCKTSDTTLPTNQNNDTYNVDCVKNNPCTDANVAANKFYFQSSDPCKFVHCNVFKQCWVMPCSPGTKWGVIENTCIIDVQRLCSRPSTNGSDETGNGSGGFDCGANNPCTDANVAANKFYFQSSDPCKFVQCNAFKQCWVRPCAPGTEWSQSNQTCVHASNNLCKTSDTTLPTNQNNDTYNVDCVKNNPCTDANVAANKFYFQSSDPCKFVQCNAFKQCWVRPCASGTEWSQSYQTCVHASNNLCKSSDTTLPTNQNNDTYNVDCVKNNPCTDANVAANKFYFQSSDPCKFVQCNVFKQCWVKPCSPGTKWGVAENICIPAAVGTCQG